ncbi:alpha/beta fold hydrolase [Yinghuangia seranimata]|uniref:alpha/beta fold hydrolase n=1 Tax=Yinghuangia seranimata TaxID=408067 RepID=UPI00248CE1BE|nr:alpha/beta hydrolase [Yinghuangia seranimata]MDI2131000.1 alpha/beta hydrolase [Yinghuangia seranimata]
MAVAGGRPPGEFVGVDGVVLHTVRQGRGPAVVVTSGLGGAWFDWDFVVPGLADECEVVRFDRPGLGFSQADREPPTLRREAERIRGLLDTLGVPGPYVLVAHSFAAFHAEAFARLYPGMTAGLVLVDPSVEAAPRPLPARGARLAAWRAIGAGARLTGVSRPLGPALRRLAVLALSRTRRDAADPALMRRAYGSGRFLTAAFTENTTYRDQAADLIELRRGLDLPDVPLRVLAAAGSRETLAARARWLREQRALAALAPRGRCDVLDDAAHLLMLDRPDAVVAAVREVLAEAK